MTLTMYHEYMDGDNVCVCVYKYQQHHQVVSKKIESSNVEKN